MSAVKTSASLQLASIDQLPRGTALNAARTPVSKDAVRAASFSKQPLTISTSEPVDSSSNDTSPGSESTEVAASPNNEASRRASNGTDLARRAARRVSVWKKSEQERRGEEERARQAKQEQEKRRQNHAAHTKQRRRAEIYALNALLRQLQQEKLAQFIAAQTQIHEAQKDPSLTSMTAALVQVEAVGV
ncbi:hypothetical protein JG687_00007951 [Phytophthora cactorum]|uniref:Uncharacterized protein n=1 Tax=Phytophthora cactorum TaxID=29920 RepID=A0A329S5Q8_9STRA|nr:hypothetical protein Pcac1_g1382 [Phytophthora cactorum]KAG2837193.1 hypothetical protein PC111_g4744 [Phytophthora cactorum]KAG2837927.1 hypothetical protein PC112_g4697 [Phytophthora cactorum]KAG2862794.1 hypothetical protein PC113_g5975 [Phytophthora cactorum]KAG2923279.1 hypothetical protein PC114_g4877 [Phytophthora cactorum]